MGQPYESVTVETKDHVAQVTLIGPGKGNAMGPAFWSDLRELALTGKDIDAARAEKIGLVNDVFADAEATLQAAHATAAEIAANPPLAVRGIKDVLDQQRISAVSASLRYVAAWNAAFLPSKDLSEGISATFAKRAPQFTGE